MKAALIGCGLIAKTHIEALLLDKQEIVAISDINYDQALKIKEKYNLDCKIFIDYKKMIDEVDIDVVHILVPHFLHTEMIIYALKHDLNVLCEKPVCINEDDFMLIEDTLKQSKGQLGVNFQSRYLYAYKKIKEITDTCKRIDATATILWSRDSKYYLEGHGIKKIDGGGVLMTQAIHTLDVLIWLQGMPTSVCCNIANYHMQDVIDTEDSAMLYLDTPKGKTVLFATTACPRSYPIEVTFNTDKGTIKFINNHVYINGEEIEIKENEGIIELVTEAHYRFIIDFYKYINNKEHFPLDLNEGFKAVKTVLKAYESNGKKINII